MKVVMPFEPFSGSVLAYTSNVEAFGAFVIQNLLPVASPSVQMHASGLAENEPLSMYLLPPFFAVVFMLTTSLPEPGSDMASEPTALPAMRSGKYFFFCSSVPLRTSWFTQRFELSIQPVSPSRITQGVEDAH